MSALTRAEVWDREDRAERFRERLASARLAAVAAPAPARRDWSGVRKVKPRPRAAGRFHRQAGWLTARDLLLSLRAHTLLRMTGGEIAAAAGAAKAAAGALSKATEQDDEVKQALLDKAKETSAMERAADAYARRIAVKEEIRLNLWRPVARMLGVSREYFDSEFASDMAAKTADIPDDELVEPRGIIAGPAVVGLSYSLDEPDLKEMYLNLLATAADRRSAARAHPSFVEIIRQLSGPEAALLRGILAADELPIVRINKTNVAGLTYEVLQSNILNLRDKDTGAPFVDPLTAAYVDNWVRLGLVNVSHLVHVHPESNYAWVDERPELAEMRRLHESDGYRIEPERGHLAPTDYGRLFAQAVIGIGPAAHAL